MEWQVDVVKVRRKVEVHEGILGDLLRNKGGMVRAKGEDYLRRFPLALL